MSIIGGIEFGCMALPFFQDTVEMLFFGLCAGINYLHYHQLSVSHWQPESTVSLMVILYNGVRIWVGFYLLSIGPSDFPTLKVPPMILPPVDQHSIPETFQDI